jgi:hypothetical protein
VAQVATHLVLQQPEAERLRRGRVVTELWILHQPVDRIDPEAVDAALDPEAYDALHSGHDLRVVPVEIRLLRIERVQVPAT